MVDNLNLSEKTDSADKAADAPLTQGVALQLTQEIKNMIQQLLQLNNNTKKKNSLQPANTPQPLPQPAPIPSAPMHQPNSEGYYPKRDEIYRSCRRFYMDFTEVLNIVTSREWLKSLQILVTLNRCAWILQTPTTRPAGVSDFEESQLQAAVMAAFQLRIPYQ